VKIDCTQCEMYRSDHCNDCLVTALLHPPEGAVDIDDDLANPLGTLSEAGLIPVLRFRPREARQGHPPPGEADQRGASAG
jgi:hypothetical protein